MILEIFLLLYFCTNCFIAGMNYETLCYDEKRLTVGLVLTMTFYCLFMLLLLCGVGLYWLFKEYIRPELRFYFNHYFRFQKKFGNFTEELLEENRIIGNNTFKGYIKDRWNRHLDKTILKLRNGKNKK